MFDSLMRLFRLSHARLRYPADVGQFDVEEQAELVALLRDASGGFTWTQAANAVLEYGSASAARERLGANYLFSEAEHEGRLREARRDIRSWLTEGLEFWTITDNCYPARVRDIQEAPPFLFARGHRVDNDIAVSVVGSRKASTRGLKMASAISEALVGMGVSVVAGLAAGIDTAAHESALAAGGRTVAVIGTGIRKYYPANNRSLQDRIATEGLLLSQFWPDAPPQAHNFPMRNAVMSGYGNATVVVEAGEQSGARIQARLAVQHGRPVILTDLVADSTEWGKAHIGRPDVYLATSIDDVTLVVGDLINRPRQLGDLLNKIAV